MNPNNYPTYPNKLPQHKTSAPSNPFSQINGQQTTIHNTNRRAPVNSDHTFSQISKQKMKNGMFSSTIELNKPAKSIVSLDSMCRFVGSDKNETPQFKNEQQIHNIPKYQKPSMASSTIFHQQAKQELDRFPAFNLHIAKKAFLTNNTEHPQKISQNATQLELTPQQKRRRQIQAIRLEFEEVNKKVVNLNKPKPYAELDIPTEVFKTSEVPAFLKAKNLQPLSPNGFNSQKKTQDLQISEQDMKQFKGLDKGIGLYNQHETDQCAKNLRPLGRKTAEQLVATSSTTSSFRDSSGSLKCSVSPDQSGFRKKNTPYLIDELQKEHKPQIQLGAKKMQDNRNFQQMKQKQKRHYQCLEKAPKEQVSKFKKSDFTIIKKLGKGQFGEVNLVQHKISGFLCGMKVMEKKQIRQEKYGGQIARQLSIQFYLNHRNVAPLYGYFSDEQNVYLLLEFCADGQLLEKLRKDRRMEEQNTSLIIRQILEGIDYIHKEYIIHRDIKPQNILFNNGVVKICDFGWAVYRGQGMRKTASGSPLYYSPEIVNGDEYDQKVDIWDIGMMTYQCLLGKIPFKIYSQLDLKRIVTDEVKFPDYVDVTDQAKDFILRTLKKKPEDRMEIRQMLRHPFISKYKDKKLASNIMEDLLKIVNG